MDWWMSLLFALTTLAVIFLIIQIVLLWLFIRWIKHHPIGALFALAFIMALSCGELFTPAFVIGLTGIITCIILTVAQWQRLKKALPIK